MKQCKIDRHIGEKKYIVFNNNVKGGRYRLDGSACLKRYMHIVARKDHATSTYDANDHI